MLKSLTPTAEQMILDWQTKAARLADAKVIIFEEMAARKAVVEHVFGDDSPAGTNDFNLGNGYLLKFVKTIDYKLDKSPADPADPTGDTKLDKAIDKIMASGNEGQFIAERLVKYEPTLSVSEYKKLTPVLKAIIDEVITTKPASPELTIKAPAAAK